VGTKGYRYCLARAPDLLLLMAVYIYSYYIYIYMQSKWAESVTPRNHRLFPVWYAGFVVGTCRLDVA